MRYLCVFILFFSGYIYGQNIKYQQDSLEAEKLTLIADSLVISNNLDQAIMFFENSASKFKEANLIEKYLEQFSGIYYCLSLKGNIAKYLGYKDSIAMYINKGGEATLWSYYKPYASIYGEKGNIKQAIKFHFNGIEKLNNIKNIPKGDIVEFYSGIGRNYLIAKDYKVSLYYFNKISSLLEKEDPNYYFKLFRLYQDLGIVYYKLKDYSKSIDVINEGLFIAETKMNLELELNKWLYIRGLLNALFVYIKKENQEEIALSLNKILKQDIYKYSQSEDVLKQCAHAYQVLNNFKLSKEYYSKSLQIARKRYKAKHRYLASTYRDFATFYLEQDSTKKALNLYQKGITALVYDFNDTTNIYKNPNLNKILAENVLLTIFEKKAIALNHLYEQEGDQKALESALEVYGKADSLVARIRQNIQTEGSKQFLAETSLPVYEGAIATALKLYEVTQNSKYQERAFLFAEKNKATVLLEAIKENEAKDMYLPDSLLEKETDLKVDLAYFEKKLYKEENKGAKMDSSKVREYQNELFDLNRDYEAFQKKIEKDFPDYFALKYNEYTPSVIDIQKNLKENTAFVEYFMGDSTLYTFVISKNDLQIYESDKNEDFEKVVQDYRKGLTDYRFFLDSTEVAQKSYLESAYQLYDWTLKETCNDLSDNINQLIIVPDDLLSFVNFETLVKNNQSDFNDLSNFLIEDYAISYAYSGRHLFEKKIDAKKSTDLVYGGFAPIYESDELMAENEGESEEDATEIAIRDFKTRGGYVDLPEARETVKKIADLLQGKQWLGVEATEQNFKEHVADYDILHLAMHGVTNNDNPLYSKLIFTQTADTLQDDYLNAYELYTMKLNAELTVLSACNTGFGELKKGEGVMSLARAFAYAGCPSLVMSLWSVPSEETANIMYNFYDGLKVGKDKNIALRDAKLGYLQNAISERKHPFFWAGFIPIGDTTPIFEKPTNWIAYLGTGLGALTLIFILLFFVNKRRNIT